MGSVDVRIEPRIRKDDLPRLFAGLNSFNISAEEIALAQETFNEMGLYAAICDYARAWSQVAKRPARILDLCSATGLCALHVSHAVPTSSITLVDTDEAALSHSARSFSHVPTFKAIVGDAATYGASEPFDIILLNSAYHHIENVNKAAFLTQVRENLARGGIALLGD